MGTVSNTYRPVFMLALMAEHHLFGFQAWGFHLVNVLLHAVNTVLVFSVASFLFSRDALRAKIPSPPDLKTIHVPAFLAALVFALHTINTEPVAWISAIPELIFTFCLLVSFYLYIRAEDWGRMALPISLLSFFLALLTKETAIVLVLLIPAYELSNHGRALFKRWRAYLPYLVTAAVYMVIRTSVMGGGLHNKFFNLSIWESLINIFPLIAKYLGKLLFPWGLSAIYPIPPAHSIMEPMVIIGIITALLYLCVLFAFRKNSFVFFGLLWVFIPLLPVMYVPAIPVSSMADRYLYLPTIGFAMLAAYLARFLFLRTAPAGYARSAVVLVTAIILVGYSASTITRSLVWKNSLTLWTDAAEKFPESPQAHLRLAVNLQKTAQVDSAIIHYKEAIRYREDFNFDQNKDKADYNLAVIYQERGELASAITHYKEVIRLRTRQNTAAAHYNLAILYHKKEEHAVAIDNYKQAIRLGTDEEAAAAHYNLATLYQDRGEDESAIYHLREVVKMDPQSLAAYYRLAVSYERGGESAGAIASYREVLRIKPGYKDAHYNMGLIYAGDGLLENAAVEFEAVLAIDPSYDEARAQLDRVMSLRKSGK
jgi:tetratricopeptide (TPR) repeat protein